MSGRDLLEETLEGLFRRRLAGPETPRPVWSPALWDELEAGGLTLVGIDDRLGGSGGTLAEAVTVARVAARWRAPVPVADSCLVAAAILAAAGREVPGGLLAAVDIGDVRVGDSHDVVACATAEGVPWASVATGIVVLGRSDGRSVVGLVPARECEVTNGVNLAGEPRDRVRFTDVRVRVSPLDEVAGAIPAAERLMARGALARSAQMVGVLDWVLDATVRHATDRHQFGKPLSTFQAIQHHLAVLAGEVTRAAAALDLVVGTGDREIGDLEVTVAKVTAGEAASVATRLAHQVHGAIGYTLEHPLHEATRRLWAWRDEFGDETLWAGRIGRAVTTLGPDLLWPTLTRSPGPREPD